MDITTATDVGWTHYSSVSFNANHLQFVNILTISRSFITLKYIPVFIARLTSWPLKVNSHHRTEVTL
jgi:hypothetical protein